MSISRPARGPSSRATVAGHRDDLQGLRAVAVLLVALSHAGVSFLAGGFVGVDVFFVLSGFLITGLLLKEAREDGTVSIGGFYQRRARRILPAAALTLVATDIVAYQVLNFVRAKQVMWDSIWASVFASNIHFARVGTDYFAQSQPPSPIQQFWTLSVEEQFYIVWPALLSVILFGAVVHRRRHGRRAGRSGLVRLLMVAAVIVSASLAWSIVETGRVPTAAYFSTLTRVWEIALGAILAVAVSLGLPMRVWRLPAGWAGLGMIAAAGVLYSSGTVFPGYAALLPTVGAALVIVAGIGSAGRLGVGRLLSIAPMRYIGDRSYTFYLWHWPVLVLAADRVGHRLTVQANLLLLAGAFALSIVTYKLFENPLRRMEWSVPASAAALSGSVAAVVAVAAVTLTSIDSKALALAAVPVTVGPALVSPAEQAKLDAAYTRLAAAGASSVLPAVEEAVKSAQQGASIPTGLTPPVSDLLHSEYSYPGDCGANDGQTSSRICRLGSASASRSLVVMGDSHAQMWMPAILEMGSRDGWTVVPLTKSGCTPTRWVGDRATAECHAWYGWAVGRAQALHPDVFVIGGSYSAFTGADADAALAAIDTLTTTMQPFARRVVVLGDPPPRSRQPVDCLLAPHATMQSCTDTWTYGQGSETRAVATDAAANRAGFIDTLGWFCSGQQCPLVIGQTIAYADQGHLTAAYASDVAAAFRAAFVIASRHTVTP